MTMSIAPMFKFIECLLYARHSPNCFTFIELYIPSNYLGSERHHSHLTDKETEAGARQGQA